MELLRNARYNKGMAFTEEERRVHFLTGLLPPAVETQELQVKRSFLHVSVCTTEMAFYLCLNEFYAECLASIM